MAADFKCDDGDKGGDSRDNEEYKPNWADNEIFFDNGSFAVVINGLRNMNDTESGEIADFAIN